MKEYIVTQIGLNWLVTRLSDGSYMIVVAKDAKRAVKIAKTTRTGFWQKN